MSDANSTTYDASDIRHCYTPKYAIDDYPAFDADLPPTPFYGRKARERDYVLNLQDQHPEITPFLPQRWSCYLRTSHPPFFTDAPKLTTTCFRDRPGNLKPPLAFRSSSPGAPNFNNIKSTFQPVGTLSDITPTTCTPAADPFFSSSDTHLAAPAFNGVRTGSNNTGPAFSATANALYTCKQDGHTSLFTVPVISAPCSAPKCGRMTTYASDILDRDDIAFRLLQYDPGIATFVPIMSRAADYLQRLPSHKLTPSCPGPGPTHLMLWAPACAWTTLHLLSNITLHVKQHPPD
jgi:hypothetical protein